MRHRDNRKWFGLFFPVKYSKLGIDESDKANEYCDVLNAKCEPGLIEFLIRKPGIIRAYHMSKQHWISVFLDGTVELDEIKEIIDISYELTS